MAASQFIQFSLPTTTFDIFSENWAELLAGAKVVKATHCFKHSFAMRTKRIDTEAVNFFLSACVVEALNFTIRSCSWKIRHDHIFKAAGFVLSRCDATGF